MAHPYEERFVGYGKDRVSWNYELAARAEAGDDGCIGVWSHDHFFILE